MLVKYVRDDGRFIGCVVAIKHDGKIALGFSQCNPKDKFNKRIARDIAIGRAKNSGLTVPSEKYRDLFDEELNFMADRAKKYFKDI